VAQIREPGCGLDLGLTETTVTNAKTVGARSLIIGIAPAGGRLPPSWRPQLVSALEHGLDIVHGLHQFLSEDPELAATAAENHRTIHDVRRPPRAISVGTGEKRAGMRLLTVGTDCAVGKKYAALKIHEQMLARGWDADFRATGQTGIMIAGTGIPMDAVVADFVAGAAELLSPSASDDHWDVIEGQGSLFHPSYAGVSLGLLHGSQPDAIVLCHDASRSCIDGLPDYPLPDLREAIDRNLQAGALTNPAVRCVGLCINTSRLSDADQTAYLGRASNALGLPCVDPMRTGVEPLLDQIARQFQTLSRHAC
jgi:uncharacterized NAD-dependent epimerase/dehydratase family protein